MQMISQSHLLMSFLGSAIGLSACSSSSDMLTDSVGGMGGTAGVAGSFRDNGQSGTAVVGVAISGQAGAGTAAGTTEHIGAAGSPVFGGPSFGAAAGASISGAPSVGGASATAGNVGVAGGASVAGVAGWSFDTLDGWETKPADSFIPLRIDATAGTTLAAKSGMAVLTVPFGPASDAALQTAAIQREISPPTNMTGLTLTLKMRWDSGGVGPLASEGGFDIYLVLSDADWTEGIAGRGELLLADRAAPGFKSFTYHVPARDGTWDPSSIQRIQVRIDSKYWVGPTFDYVTAVFEIDSIS